MKLYQQLSVLRPDKMVVIDFKADSECIVVSRIYKGETKGILLNEEFYNKIKLYTVNRIETSQDALYITVTN